METKFISWLTSEMDARGWSNSELARQANIVPSTVSMIVSGQKNAGYDFCVKVAHAFDMPPENVMREAGLLPPLPGPENDPTLKELMDYARQLSPEERKRLANVAQLYFREQRERYEAEEKRKKNTGPASAPAT